MSKPLTIDELKALQVGDWVWLIVKRNYGDYKLYDKIVKQRENEIVFAYCTGQNVYQFSDYGTKWLAYKNKEQAGIKVEWMDLPCKVGDTMWLLNDPLYVADICEVVIEEITIKRNGIIVSCVYADEYCDFKSDFIFKTKEQAEARLKELRGEK